MYLRSNCLFLYMPIKCLPHKCQWNTSLHVKRKFRKRSFLYWNFKIIQIRKKNPQTNKILHVKFKCHYSIFIFSISYFKVPPNQKNLTVINQCTCEHFLTSERTWFIVQKVKYMYHIDGQWLNKLDVKQMNWDRSWISGLQMNQYHTKKGIL